MARSKSTASDPFAAALRLLTRRDRSEAELREKLAQFGFSAAAIDATVEKCRRYNYLDDQRYALERARTLLRTGRGVGRKVLLELQRRGIDGQLAAEALEQATGEICPETLLSEQVQRRFPDFNYPHASEKERRRVIGYLQRRGFTLEQIFALLKKNDD